MAEKTSSHQPLFFKVLLPGFFTKLEIPPAFLSHIRVEKLDTATILSPQGIPWHVKVQGDISGLYFGEGWSEFVEAHDLQYGYFLVFCYEGGLIFSLRVFDLSCCKKEYTRYVEKDVRNKKIKREYPEQEDDVKGFDGIPTPHSYGQIFVEIMKSVATSEQTKTIDNSQDQRRFETTRPHFKITIKRSHLFPKPHMDIPCSCQAFHGLSDMPEVILVDPEQRTWPVKVYHIIGKTKQKRNDFRFGPGWQAFCANNNLKQGNVCIFEPQSEEDRLIHVHIDRREVHKTNVQTDGREVQKWPASPPKPQFFRVLLPESGFTTKLSLPRTLTEYFLQKNQKQATILSPLGKSWSIKVHGNINTLFFGDGWQDFVQAHDLDVGNILVFSYEGDMVFNVAIFDPSACEKEYIPIVRNDVTHNRITTEEQNSFRASKMKRATHSSRTSELCTHSRHCKASEPCTCLWKQPFEVIMRRGYVGSRSFMNIPRRASRYLWGIAKIVLRDPKERLWPVKLIQKCEKDRKRTSFGKGWLQFRINNHLEEGDVCIFELVSEEEKVMMHVNIQKDEQNLKNNSSRQCTVEGRKHLTSSSAQHAVKKTAVKKLKPVHSEDQKVSATMGITTPAALFKATIKSGNLHPKYPYMNIPSSFRVLNDLSGVRQIILRDPNRRRWPVRVKHRVKKNAACASFASGWQSFCAGNNLKEGDVCIFELIENSNVMIVDIIKEEQVREELESDT